MKTMLQFYGSCRRCGLGVPCSLHVTILVHWRQWRKKRRLKKIWRELGAIEQLHPGLTNLPPLSKQEKP